MQIHFPGDQPGDNRTPYLELAWDASKSQWLVSHGPGAGAYSGENVPVFCPRAFFAANFTAEPKIENLELKTKSYEFSRFGGVPFKMDVPYFSFDVKLRRQDCSAQAKKLADTIAVSIQRPEQLSFGEAYVVERETKIGSGSHYLLDPFGVECTVAKDAESWRVQNASAFMRAVRDVVDEKAKEIPYAELRILGAYHDNGSFKGRVIHQITAIPRGNPKVLKAEHYGAGALAHPFLK